MRLAAFAFFAALLLAPLAAQAAQPPARFAVTLEGTIVDRLTYEQNVADEECTSRKTGDGGRELAVRSLRPTRIEVTRGASGVAYRPARVAALRVAATRLAGTFSELRRCRFLPPERLSGRCQRAAGTVQRMRAGFRTRRSTVLFGRSPALGDATACGLDQKVTGGWLNLVRGRIDQDALLNGRSLRVVARASGTRESTIGNDPTLKVTQRTTVRWALTFRRLG